MEKFWKKISELKLVEKNDNIDTYEAYMKVSIKKIEIKDEKQLLFYKQKLISNKKNFKIYDIEEDEKNNILYIIYDTSQNINELLNQSYIHINKEAIIEGHSEPSTKNEIIQLFEKENSMCRIKTQKIIKNKLENLKASAFLLQFQFNDIPFNKCLITNNHILDKKDIQIGKEVKFIHNNIEKKIKITKERRVFTDEKLDYTCIEILNEDNI